MQHMVVSLAKDLLSTLASLVFSPAAQWTAGDGMWHDRHGDTIGTWHDRHGTRSARDTVGTWHNRHGARSARGTIGTGHGAM